MLANNELHKVRPKKLEQGPDSSAKYREIGIKAVAAAAHNETEQLGGASGDQEPKRRAREKANG